MSHVQSSPGSAAPTAQEIVAAYPEVSVSRGTMRLPLGSYVAMMEALCPPNVEHTPEGDAQHLLGMVAGSGAELHPSHAAFLDSLSPPHA